MNTEQSLSKKHTTLKIVNPATGIKITRIPKDNATTVAEKYAQLKTGQKAWAATTIEHRLNCIQQFFRLLDVEQTDLAETLSAEMGKPFQESLNEIQGARGRIHFFLNNVASWIQDEWMIRDGATHEKLSFEPLGVIGNISAWNYPYLVGVNVFIPALLCGNAVLYKPSEYTTMTGQHIQNLLHESGVPENVFQTVIGGGEVGELLLEQPLDAYYFTGSYRTGKYIAQKVAHKLVPVQLELGGKDPLYVADEVDVQKAAINAVEGAFYNNGQSCCAVERIYVHEAIYDEFVTAFVKELSINWVMDLPAKRTTKLGPVSRKEHLPFLQKQVDDAVAKGAKILTGGKRANRKGYYFEPTVLVNVTHDMDVMKEETFGPVIGIMAVKDDAAALSLMQDTEFGLTAAVFSHNEERAEAMLKELDAGTVYWNCCDRVSPNLPWSGRGKSGLGSTLSYIGIRAFLKTKGYHLRVW